MTKIMLPIILLFALPFFFAFSEVTLYAWFLVGYAFGLAVMLLDEMVLYKQYAAQTPDALQLITRSPLFLAAYPVLAFFAITSSGSALGVGVLLGMGIVLVAESVALQRDPARLRARFAQHLSAQVSDQDLRRGMVAAWVVLLVLSVLVFI